MPSGTEFHYRPQHNHFIDLSSTIAAGVSLILCLSVLVAAGFIWAHKSARGYLDRISFRLSLWAMVAQVIQDVVYIFLYAPTGLVDPTNPGCGAGVFFRMAMVGVVNYLFTCVAINLMLTIVFGVNPVQLRLERYYNGLSLFLGLIIPTVPACLKHFGWDPIFGTCYFTSDDRATRVRHFILDVYLWQILSCIIATVSVIMVLYKLFKQSRATQRLSSFGAITSTCSDEQCTSCTQDAGKRPNLRRLLSNTRSQGSGGCTSSSVSEQPTMAMYQLQDKLMGVALRISLYPVTLIVVNTIVTTGDLWTAIDQGIHTGAAYHMTVFHRLLCGGRGVLFAGLCLFVDPCLFRGLRFLYRERRKRVSEAQQQRTAHLAKERTSDEDEKAHGPPALDYGNYSPTFVPPGGSPPGLHEDPLSLPASSASPSLPWHTAMTDGCDYTIRHRQERLASDASMDFAQALAGPSDAQVKRASSVSMDFMSALRSGPRGSTVAAPARLLATTAPPAGRPQEVSHASQVAEVLSPVPGLDPDAAAEAPDAVYADLGSAMPRASMSSDRSSFASQRPPGWIDFTSDETPRADPVRSASQVSMDIAQALAAGPGHQAVRRPSRLSLAVPPAPEAGPSASRDRLASDVTMGMDEMLAQGPNARHRASSAVSADLLSVLAAGPDRRSSRLDSDVSMDLGAALASPPAEAAAQVKALQDAAPVGRYQPRMDILGEGRVGAFPVAQFMVDPRRPSLPQRWKDAFGDDKAGSGMGVEDAAQAMRARRTVQRRNERAQREWMRDLEKLYEEAEAQL